MKKFIILPLLVLSINSWAMECGPTIDVSEDIENLLEGVQEKKRDWWAASEDKIIKAPCRKEYPSLAEQEKYLKNLTDGVPTTKASINGVAIDDSPAMVALFKDLTTFVTYSDEYPEGSKTLGKKYNIPADCKKVTCALGKIFGDKRAKEMLYMKQKFGLNTSPLIKGRMQEFTEAELSNIKKAVMDFPSHMLPLDENQSCTRLHKDYTLGLGTLANATITFANDWNKYPAAIQQSTVLHELAHKFGGDKSIDESKEWLAASNWVKKGDDWSSNKDNFVSDYAASNPHEDFAETVVAFRYDPEKLKKVSPEKYKIIKDKVFGGVEYTTAAMCAESNLAISKSLAKIKPTLSSFEVSSITPETKKNLVSYCKDDSMNYIFDRNYRPFEDCIEGAIALELAKKQILKDNPSMKAADVENNLFSQLNGRSARDAFGVKFTDPQKKQIRDYTQSLMDDYEVAAYSEIEVFGTHKDAKSYCDEFGDKYAYQKFDELNKDMKDKFRTYNRRDEFAKVVNAKCLRVQGTFPKFKTFSKSDLKLLVR